MSDKLTVISNIMEKAKTVDEHATENTLVEAKTTLSPDFEIDPRRISDEVLKLINTMDALSTKDSLNYEVNQIEFSLGINANGKIGLFCAIAGVGGECAIKVTIKKKTK